MSGNLNDYIKYRIEKSLEIFEDAKLLMNNNRWNSCVNRLYYSSFYLVSSLLHQNGIKAESHNGTKTQFNLHFIKTTIISNEQGRIYARLFDWRQESDYADFVEFDEETVKNLFAEVEVFNNTIRELLK